MRAAANLTLDDAHCATPLLDTFAQRALTHDGASSHAIRSAVSTSDTEHVRRVEVQSQVGEDMVLTFKLAQQAVLKAAYRSVASEDAWVLQRVRGEWDEAALKVSKVDATSCSAMRSQLHTTVPGTCIFVCNSREEKSNSRTCRPSMSRARCTCAGKSAQKHGSRGDSAPAAGGLAGR